MFRKKYTRRIESLKIFKAYLQILTKATDSKEISPYTYQHILKSYLTLMEYGQHTRVNKTLREISNLKSDEGYIFDSLMEELKDINFKKINKHEFQHPKIASVFSSKSNNNMEMYENIIKHIDNTIEFYETLWDLCQNE